MAEQRIDVAEKQRVAEGQREVAEAQREVAEEHRQPLPPQVAIADPKKVSADLGGTPASVDKKSAG